MNAAQNAGTPGAGTPGADSPEAGATAGELTLDQVRQVARLSRLEFSDDQARVLAAQLSGILHYVEQLNELDVSQVEPTSHALALTNVLRADEARPSLSPQDALANAPAAEAQCFQVPPIIQEM